MKLLLVTNLYPPNSLGGYERLCAQIANGLSDRSHAVEVLTSAHGGGMESPGPIPVARTLKLLASERSIYEPFEGNAAERRQLLQSNGAALERIVRRFGPDRLLAGNLMFLDRSFLEELCRQRAPLAYLLTDVWLVQMLEDLWLQQFFRQEVLHAHPRPETQVRELTADILAAADPEPAAGDRARRQAEESRLAAGRHSYQYPGVCHLCGETVFLVRTPTEGTPMLPANARTMVSCSRCSLEGAERAVVHAADLIAGSSKSARVAFFCPDRAVASAVAARHSGRIWSSLEEIDRSGTPAVVGVMEPLSIAWQTLEMLGEKLPSETQLVALRSSSDSAQKSGSRSPSRVFEIWSSRYGYLGRDYLLGVSAPP
jgi:hypothetical protein